MNRALLLFAFLLSTTLRAEAPPSSIKSRARVELANTQPAKAELNKPVADFARADVLADGKEIKLSELLATPGRRAVVLVFQGVQCGVVDRHQPEVARLAADYADKGVAVLAVFSNVDESAELVQIYAQRVKLTVPALHDPECRLADYFSATHTPQFVIVDAQGRWRYSGPYRLNTAGTDAPSLLREALDAVLAGREVTTPVAKAFGCKIARNR